MKIGEILLKAGLLDAKQLEIGLAEQAKTGARLGLVLTELGFASDEAVSRALAEQSGVEYCELDEIELQPEALKLVPQAVARRLSLLPIRIESGNLVIAMSNPTDIVAIDEVQRGTDLFVRVICASHRQVASAIDRGYSDGSQSGNAFDPLVDAAVAEVEGGEAGSDSRGAVSALLDEILSMAVRSDATDVHLQPDPRVVRVRFRVDGELLQGPTFRASLLPPLVARVKVLSDLDISETRLPQDGKIRFPVGERVVDLRISTFPSISGESVVIRILDKERHVFSLETLGFTPALQLTLRKMAKRPNGMILAAGPTGSGKSTTLYALLKSANASRRKIITLEDPVEYETPLVTQCQVNERAGLTFAAGLRSILRHDPDVVLVGEMRDTETAMLAMRAALTGHLVLSTLHTNDAVRSISRLRDMGIDTFVIASCLACVSAQRLVRRICPSCRVEYEPGAEELTAVGLPEDATGRFARGTGCDRCHGSGQRGREALFEVLEVKPGIATLIGRGAPVDEIEAAALANGMVSFRQMAQQRAIEGMIPLTEVAAVTAEF